MKKGIIKNMFNSALADSGNDSKKAGQLVARTIEKILNDESKGIEPKDFNFAQMAHELIPGLADLRSADASEVANAVGTSQFPVLSKVILHKQIMKAYELNMEGVGALVTEAEASRTTDERIGGFTESESLEMRLEGMSYEETNFGEKDVTVRMADFGRLISITREAIFNDRTGQLLANARKIGDKAGIHRAKMIVQTIEVQPRTAFKEASGASKAFIYKGSAYQSSAFYNATNHTSIDSRTNANLVASNGLANYNNIKAAMDLFTKMKDSQGDEIVIKPDTILVHADNLIPAWQILNTASYTPVGQGKVEAIIDRHVANPYGPGGLSNFKVLGTRYMTASTTWYLGKFNDQLIWLWVYKPATASLAATAEKAFTNNIIVTYKFSYHGGCGNTDYVNVVKNTA